jgi:hypothetical protein
MIMKLNTFSCSSIWSNSNHRCVFNGKGFSGWNYRKKIYVCESGWSEFTTWNLSCCGLINSLWSSCWEEES